MKIGGADRADPEFELLDTGVFSEKKYFDVFVEYAKCGVEDILIQITVFNRGPEAAPLHLLPVVVVPQYLVMGQGSSAAHHPKSTGHPWFCLRRIGALGVWQAVVTVVWPTSTSFH